MIRPLYSLSAFESVYEQTCEAVILNDLSARW